MITIAMTPASETFRSPSSIAIAVTFIVEFTVGIAVGTLVGWVDGADVGGTVGPPDGIIVGSIVGIEDGADVGCSDGVGVGMNEGEAVGELVGAAVVVDIVGCIVGAEVGYEVGLIVGAAVGKAVGVAVGVAVSPKHHSPQLKSRALHPVHRAHSPEEQKRFAFSLQPPVRVNPHKSLAPSLNEHETCCPLPVCGVGASDVVFDEIDGDTVGADVGVGVGRVGARVPRAIVTVSIAISPVKEPLCVPTHRTKVVLIGSTTTAPVHSCSDAQCCHPERVHKGMNVPLLCWASTVKFPTLAPYICWRGAIVSSKHSQQDQKTGQVPHMKIETEYGRATQCQLWRSQIGDQRIPSSTNGRF